MFQYQFPKSSAFKAGESPEFSSAEDAGRGGTQTKEWSATQ